MESSLVDNTLQLLEQCITEEAINCEIQTTQDLTLLCALLRFKLRLVSQKKCSPIDFSIDNILKQKDDSNIDKICDAVHLALLVQSSKIQHKILLENINERLINVSKENPNLMGDLKLLNVILSVITLNNEEECKLMINIRAIICNILNIDLKPVINFLCTYILPKYLVLDSSNSLHVLQTIWQVTMKSKNLDILCAISQYFIVSKTLTANGYSLVNFKEFWILLQECIMGKNSTIQKQALFLLKRAVHSLENEKCFEVGFKLVYWDVTNRGEMLDAWYKFFMLSEIFREKQLYLIEPSYHLLSSIKILHPSWLLCIYKTLLLHSHTSVSAYAVLCVLQDTWHQAIDIFESLVIHLLSAINKIEFVPRRDLWQALNLFLKHLTHQKLLMLLEYSINVSWIPPVCYQFYKSVNGIDYEIQIPFDLIEKVLRNIEKLSNKFIRNACIDLIVKFANEKILYNKKLSFSDKLTISWILYKDSYSPDTNDNLVYATELQTKIVSWINVTDVDTREIVVVVKMIELNQFEDDFFDKYIFEPYAERKFATEILDRLGKSLCLKGKVNFVIDYIRYRLQTLKLKTHVNVHDIEEILGYQATNTNLLIKDCIDVLLNEQSNIYQYELAFKIIIVSIKYSKFDVSKNDIINISNYWKQKCLHATDKFNSKLCLSFLEVYCLKNFNDNNKLRKESEIIVFEKILETQTNEVVSNVFEKLQFLIDRHENVEVVYDFVGVCFRKLVELKRTDLFRGAVDNFIKSIFCNTKIDDNNQYVIKKNAELSWKLLDLAKSCDDVAYSLVKHLHCFIISNCDLCLSLFVPIIVELLLLGEVLKREQRADYDVCQVINEDSNETMTKINPNYRRLSVRAEAVNIINKSFNDAHSTNQSKNELADTFSSLLMDKYRLHFNKRYFANSNIHLQKLRILQAFLVIRDHISKEKETLVNLLLDSLCMENHQISVKFLIQWLLIGLLSNNDQAVEIITSKMKSTSKVHSSTIIAFIPILYHVMLSTKDEVLLTKLYETMLPWTMGAHFNLRLYAQVGLQKIYQTAVTYDLKSLLEKFEVVFVCISEVLANTERTIDPIDQFVFDIFNPTDHYCLQVIYFDVPKITNISYDEYENYLWLKEFNTSPEWHEIYSNTEKNESKLCNTYSDVSTVQKKITPVFGDFFNIEEEHKTNDLIIIASLIDKSPNLGGLSRTCEIFGVKQLVLNNTNVIKDFEFQSVSMSSENWVDIVEAKSENLRKFLLELKGTGYTIVGCEQTSNSAKLDSFQFSKKSALLLGNEKEGIPPDLLSLVDVCVEIPQFGVVRSLNVHVAAATFIWEYTKQHALHKNSNQ